MRVHAIWWFNLLLCEHFLCSFNPGYNKTNIEGYLPVNTQDMEVFAINYRIPSNRIYFDSPLKRTCIISSKEDGIEEE